VVCFIMRGIVAILSRHVNAGGRLFAVDASGGPRPAMRRRRHLDRAHVDDRR
jgi:hypothetical protein